MQRKEILNEIENNPSILQDIDKKYLSDEEFMLSILKMNPILACRFIDDSLLSDKNFIEKALLIENNTNILDIVPKNIKLIVLCLYVISEILFSQLEYVLCRPNGIYTVGFRKVSSEYFTNLLLWTINLVACFITLLFIK